MATDMFLKIDGIKGESHVSKHEGEIDVMSWSWGVSNMGTAHAGGGMGAGKASFNDLTITKAMDKSSPSLYKVCANGKHIKEATLVVRKAGEEPLDYIIITMQDILVTNISTSGAAGAFDNGLTESVSLNFSKVKYKYIEQTETGAAGEKPDFNWDIRAYKAM